MSGATERTTGYNGWTNYETWLVALWLGNEPGTSKATLDKATEHKELAPGRDQVERGVWTEEQAARFTLADDLKEWVSTDLVPDLGTSLASELLGAALSEVSWDELASSYLSEL